MNLYEKLTNTINILEHAGLEGLNDKELLDLLEEIRNNLIIHTPQN